MHCGGVRIKPEESQKPMPPDDPEFYKHLLDQMSDGVYFVDRDRRIQYWNQGAYRLTGYKAEELLGRCCQDDILCHVDMAGKRLCQDGCPLSASILDGGPREANVFLRHKQGRRVPVAVRVQPIQAADGSVIGAIEIFNDNSAQLDARRKIEAMNRLAFLDHLTQLPNRRFLDMSLHTAFSEYLVHQDPFGIMVIDLDGFKAINDTFGHVCGDRALQQVARTLAGALRPTDIVGRWGGDEFLAIAGNVNLETLAMLAERCVALVTETAILTNDEKHVSLSISVGAALVRPGETSRDLLHRADELMYRSKTSGRCRVTTE